MKLQIHSIHFAADQKLLTFIQKKCDKLETFYDRIIDGEVFLKIDKADTKKANKIVEIKLTVPGDILFSKEKYTSFEGATKLAVEALRRQLKKRKEKVLAK